MITPFEKFKDNAVCITGYPKSGTTLLLSLLDHHPQLVVMPEELKFFDSTWPKKNDIYALFNVSGLSAFKPEAASSFNDNRDYSCIDYDYFKKTLTQRVRNAKSDKEIYLAIMETFFEVENNGNSKKAHVEKSPNNEYNFPELYKWFGKKLVILHVVRNPLDNFVSFRKKREKAGRVFTMQQFCRDWMFSNLLISEYQKMHREVHVIRYEDMVDNPRLVMQKVCAWVGINWSDTLLQPTRAGLPWSGNSMHNLNFQGISSEPKGIHKKILSQDEINQLCHMIYSPGFSFKLYLAKRLLIFKLKLRYPLISKALKRH